MSKILFITTANLSSNPRLLKEISLAKSLNYTPDILAFRQGGWSDSMDEEIWKKLNLNVTYLSALRKPLVPWIISSLIQVFCTKIWRLRKKDLKITGYAVSKRSYLLIRHLQEKKRKYDLVIGHNLGALYPAWWYAKKYGLKFGFDVEDYHPGEKIYKDVKNETERRLLLFEKILPKTEYTSYASPLIRKTTLDHFKSSKPQVLVNNCFPASEFVQDRKANGKVKFIWFSQNISHSRGLELVINAMDDFPEALELHLIGNLSSDFHAGILNNRSFIRTHSPLPQADLNRSLSQYDVGLAIELNRTDFNRQICLTNKIWSYFQAGVYIMATDTPAQELFLKDQKNAGELCGQDVPHIKVAIERIVNNIETIRKQKQNRFLNAREFNWEKESSKLKATWDQLLHL